MTKYEQRLVKRIDKLIKDIELGSGKEKCEGFDLDCASCRIRILISLLMWYQDTLLF